MNHTAEATMNKGARIIIYPVKDLARAKAAFKALLGVEPYSDEKYYVGFKVEGQDIGLDPNGHKAGATAYFHVDDIRARLMALTEAGGEVVQAVKDVGGGRLIASVRDPEGNMIGLLEDPK
jgi:predicted enzyme related to lactoylglutathione lyase